MVITETVIERVGLAIEEALREEGGDFRSWGRAALQALREPTGEMVAAGGDLRDADYALVGSSMAEEVFQAMIDAALQEKT